MIKVEPRYSVFIYSKKSEDFENIKDFLNNGLKVYYLTSRRVSLNEIGVNNTKLYKDMYINFVINSSSSIDILKIFDGDMSQEEKEKFKILSNEAESFNQQQYKAIHSNKKSNLLIKASAGTGKTTVLINRILYLILVHEIPIETIGMITFTNDAEKNMKAKLTEEMLKRYKISKDIKYLRLLENIGKLNSYTIHSFSKNILKDISFTEGFGNNMVLKQLTYEKKQIIDLLIDHYLKENGLSLKENFSDIQLYKLREVTYDFWEKMVSYGLNKSQIESIDWGENITDYDIFFKKIFTNLAIEFKQMKKQLNAISINDIIIETLNAINSNQISLQKFEKLKFLFVDEFQDTDLAQIEIIKTLKNKFNLIIFLVGDKKQSIYRFRGAQASTFESIEDSFDNLVSIQLAINYRSSKNLIIQTQKIFTKMFKDYKKNSAFLKTDSNYRVFRHLKEDEKKIKIKDLLDNIKKGEVAFLVRSNEEVKKIKKWCEEFDEYCEVQIQGGFYQQDIVIDFYYLIAALLYPNITKFQFQYLNSCFSDKNLPNEYCEKGFKETISGLFYTEEMLKYLEMFRMFPVLEVIQKIISNSNYEENLAQDLRIKNLPFEYMSLEIKNYRENLHKLIIILQETFSTEVLSLQMIFEFLKRQIQTNKSEGIENSIKNENNKKTIKCMTIHKAKGLEFDCVIIPFTKHKFFNPHRNHLLLHYNKNNDKILASWKILLSKKKKYHENKSIEKSITNSHYTNGGEEKEILAVKNEEMRLLYVALTRAKKHLYIFEDKSKNSIDWGKIVAGESDCYY